MTDTSPENPALHKFLAALPSIPWFSKIGQPIASDSNVVRILSWDEWPGPEDPDIIELSIRQQALYDVIMEKSPHETAQLQTLWEQIHRIVFRDAAPSVPYDSEQDTWHAPTAAVWQAAWNAGLMGLCLQLSRPIPEEILEQWEWFSKGHWPSGFACAASGSLLLY